MTKITKYPPADIVVFGVTSDLASRKLLPALYQLFRKGCIESGSQLIGTGRNQLDSQQFATLVRTSLDHCEPDRLDDFLHLATYCPLDVDTDQGWDTLAGLLHPNRLRLLYLALGSNLFAPLCQQLDANQLATSQTRLVVEKPIGHDLQSARQLNHAIHKVFDESQIFRIDHYLGKETVQNLMALRFANSLFEPLWNSKYIDHVQITVAESIGVEGRGDYYEGMGAIRDMVQNHLLQLLCLSAMEAPYTFNPNAVRDEKLKVLRSLQPFSLYDIAQNTVRGQYTGGRDNPHSYLDDLGKAQSNTETFTAIRTCINNWRWAGTPFYLRTGKALSNRISEIVVAFKNLPHSIFSPSAGRISNNQLVIRVQPDESILLHIMIKDPRRKSMGLLNVPLDMTFAETLGSHYLLDAYERLLLDVLRNDQTLFMRHDEVEAAWGWIDPIAAAWEETRQPLFPYARGSQGPNDALRLISQGGDRYWREL